MSTRKEVPGSQEAQQVLDLLKRVCDDIHGACKAVLKAYHKKLEKEGIVLQNPAESGKNKKSCRSSHDNAPQDDSLQVQTENETLADKGNRSIQVLIRELFDSNPLPVALKAIALEIVEKQLVQELSHEIMIATGQIEQRKRTYWPVVAPYPFVGAPPMNNMFVEFPNGTQPTCNSDMPPMPCTIQTVGLPVMNKPPLQVSNPPEPPSQIVQCADNPVYDIAPACNIGAPMLAPPDGQIPPVQDDTFQLANVTNAMPADQNNNCLQNETKGNDHNIKVSLNDSIKTTFVKEANSSVEKANSPVKEAADSLSDLSRADDISKPTITNTNKEATEKQTKDSQIATGTKTKDSQIATGTKTKDSQIAKSTKTKDSQFATSTKTKDSQITTSTMSKDKSSSHSSKSHHKYSSSSSKTKFNFEGFRIKSEKSSDHSGIYPDIETDKKKNLKEKLNLLKEQLKLSSNKADKPKITSKVEKQKITKESLLEKFQKGDGSSTDKRTGGKEEGKEKSKKGSENGKHDDQDEHTSELVGSTTIGLELPVLSFKKHPRDPRSAKPCRWEINNEESTSSPSVYKETREITCIPKWKNKVTPFQPNTRKRVHPPPHPMTMSGFCSGPCGRHCAVCSYMLPTNIIKSNNQDIVRLKDIIDCNTTDLIYAVYCMRCDKALCVNVTSQALKSRLQTQISAAKTGKGDSLSLHFNSGEHTLRDLAAVGLETNRSKDREEHWITLLCTWRPFGLNIRARCSTPDLRKADIRHTRSTTAPPESKPRTASPDPYQRHKRFKHM